MREPFIECLRILVRAAFERLQDDVSIDHGNSPISSDCPDRACTAPVTMLCIA
jgi:hypothetical protein